MSALAPAGASVGRLRQVHLGMIDAVLAGGGVARVAQLAAEQLRGTVRIELPSLQLHVVAPAERRAARVVAAVPVRSGDETLGEVALLDAAPPPDAREILELAALATVTAVTLRDAHVSRRRAAAELFEDIAAGAGDDIVRRARKLGADLSRGAAALAVRPASDRVVALVAQELPGALVAVRQDVVEALVPVQRDPLGLARRLRAGLSPPGHDFAAAQRFARLALELGRDPAELRTGTWRLLIDSEPAALEALVESTVAPAGDLAGTLRAYLEHGASISATAAAVHAHRHTVASRLERIRRLTGHDPQTPAGQTQLALGLQAQEVLAALSRAAR